MGFADEASALSYYRANSKEMRQIISFKDSSSGLPSNLHFDIRPHTGDKRWRTKQNYRFTQGLYPRNEDNPRECL